jgi:hypothetical protein
MPQWTPIQHNNKEKDKEGQEWSLSLPFPGKIT